MYYVLESMDAPIVRHLINKKDDGYGSYFLKGFLVTAPKEHAELYVEFESNKINLPDFFEADGVPIVTKKFIQLLENAGIDNIQAFPVEIRFKDSLSKDYVVLNVIGRVKCFDERLTNCSKFGSRIMRVFSLKLKDDIPDLAIFRADEYQEIIFISEHLKNSLTASNISGYQIRKAEGWSDEHRF